MTKKKETKYDKLAQLVVGEIHDLRDHMDSRFETIDKRFENIENELSHISASLAYITNRLDALEEKVAGLTGYAKEIDELRERIRAIELHLKMKSVRKPVRV